MCLASHRIKNFKSQFEHDSKINKLDVFICIQQLQGGNF